MVTCRQCGREFAKEEPSVASISGSILGDECIESYFLCTQCGFYTVEVFWDLFSGEESVSTRGPLSREEGEEQVRVIRRCAEPWNKKCRCDAHMTHFAGSLD